MRSFTFIVAFFCFLFLILFPSLSDGTITDAFFSLNVAGENVLTFYNIFPYYEKFSFINT